MRNENLEEWLWWWCFQERLEKGGGARTRSSFVYVGPLCSIRDVQGYESVPYCSHGYMASYILCFTALVLGVSDHLVSVISLSGCMYLS